MIFGEPDRLKPNLDPGSNATNYRDDPDEIGTPMPSGTPNRSRKDEKRDSTGQGQRVKRSQAAGVFVLEEMKISRRYLSLENSGHAHTSLPTNQSTSDGL